MYEKCLYLNSEYIFIGLLHNFMFSTSSPPSHSGEQAQTFSNDIETSEGKVWEGVPPWIFTNEKMNLSHTGSLWSPPGLVAN
jgi:hypothetical protein